MRKVMIGMLLVALMMSLAGCRQHERNSTISQEESSEKDVPQELLVFDCTTTGSLLKNYQAAHPETMINSWRMKADQIDRYVQKFGEPDIILFESDGSSMRMTYSEGLPNGQTEVTVKIEGGTTLEDLIKADYALDMSSLLEADQEIDLGLYYPGTMNIGCIDGKLYAIPLSLQADYIILSDSQLKGSAFESLSEGYSAMELLNAVLSEMDKAIEEEKYWYSGYSGGYKWLYDVGAISYENGEVRLDQELFSRVWQIMKKQEAEIERRLNEDTYIKGASISIEEEDLYSYDDFAFSMVDELNTAGNCPQEWLVYANSLATDKADEAIYVFWRPIEDEKSSFAAWVGEWGIVGSGSKHPEEAYAFLRQMMDTPITVVPSNGQNIENQIRSFPINRGLALEMVDAILQIRDKYSYEDIPGDFPVIPLTEELKNDLEYYLNNITSIYSFDCMPECRELEGMILTHAAEKDMLTGYEAAKDILKEWMK